MNKQFVNLFIDIQRLLVDGHQSVIRQWITIFFDQRFYTILIYRLGRWVLYEAKGRILHLPLKVLYIIINKFIVELLFGLYIPAGCQIGPGLLINKFEGLVINPSVIIGKNCSLGHGVIIGTAGDGTSRAPTIGDNVFIGSRAIIIGGITIGDNVRIGANAVVNCDVPSNVTIAGIPAKIVRYH